MAVLVTGGTGFIGSHTVVELLQSNTEVVILDDFSNSTSDVLEGIQKITGFLPKFYKGDSADIDLLTKIFEENRIDGVIHFAASKAVGESVQNPLKYYKNNLFSLVNLLIVMQAKAIHNLVFSSSCTVYGNPVMIPVKEDTPKQKATSAYGNTKNIAEDILEDVYRSGAKLKMISLRYFNPIGAHESALIGELPNGVPSNLVPFVTQTAAGIRPCLEVFGNDYDTADGSNVRDFIHVVDLAKAHIAALHHLGLQATDRYLDSFNVGSGTGNSVLEVIREFEKVNNLTLNYKIVGRRDGDVVQIYGDVSKAAKVLNWKVEKSLSDALRDAWRWQQKLNKVNE